MRKGLYQKVAPMEFKTCQFLLEHQLKADKAQTPSPYWLYSSRRTYKSALAYLLKSIKFSSSFLCSKTVLQCIYCSQYRVHSRWMTILSNTWHRKCSHVCTVHLFEGWQCSITFPQTYTCLLAGEVIITRNWRCNAWFINNEVISFKLLFSLVYKQHTHVYSCRVNCIVYQSNMWLLPMMDTACLHEVWAVQHSGIKDSQHPWWR